MRKIYLNLLIIVFYGLTLNQLQASDKTLISPLTSFNIPTHGKDIDYNKIKFPLNFLSSHHSCDVSDAENLSIISTKVTALLQCPLIKQYNQKEQHKLEISLSLIQQKIEDLRNKNYKNNPRLEIFNKDHNANLTHERLHQCMLVKRIFDLQKYINDTHRKFLQKS